MNMRELAEEALSQATDTKACVIALGAVDMAASMFVKLFPQMHNAFVVMDPNTAKVAGENVVAQLEALGVKCVQFMLGGDGRDFHAEYSLVEEVREALRNAIAVSDNDIAPVAVGSGTINDLVKRASSELGVRYMVVGTAASMDGYTSYGAAITKDGMKQTLSCPAPLGCIVDVEIAAAAPKEMTASGYADLFAKIPAGVDWMIADALGVERIHSDAWRFVQAPLHDAVSSPEGIAAGNPVEMEKLCLGLVMSGFAMQAMGSSRPASGTEHQFSHYWDMENLAYGGKPVSHGFKVGIGTLASVSIFEFLFSLNIAEIDVDTVVMKYPQDFGKLKERFPLIFGNRPAHITRAEIEMGGKFAGGESLREQLSLLKRIWPELVPELQSRLLSFSETERRLRMVGAPFKPEQIGITQSRLQETCRGVPYMRNRFFALDLVDRLGLMDELLVKKSFFFDH